MCPEGFQSSACFSVASCGLHSVWPIQRHFFSFTYCDSTFGVRKPAVVTECNAGSKHLCVVIVADFACLVSAVYIYQPYNENRNRLQDRFRHTQLVIVLFNTVHPEDGRRRRPKHVGVVNNYIITSAFVDFFIKRALMHGVEHLKKKRIDFEASLRCYCAFYLDESCLWYETQRLHFHGPG